MTSDENKGLEITYNHLNLPTRITYIPNSKYIDITYDAAGVKLTKEVYENGTLSYTKDYVGGIEYNDNVLEAIYHAEGRITPIQGNDFIYEYSLKDHLGNSRVSFSDINEDGTIDETTEVLQENHYYPFGMQMEGLQTAQVGVENKYGYNGKEMNDDFGLGWSDYGARWYDPSIARWSAVDPLAESYIGHSPYAYVMNTPINAFDPDGRMCVGCQEQTKSPRKEKRNWSFMGNRRPPREHNLNIPETERGIPYIAGSPGKSNKQSEAINLGNDCPVCPLIPILKGGIDLLAGGIITLIAIKSIDNVYDKTDDIATDRVTDHTDEDTDNRITLYRGVSTQIKSQHSLAMMGKAIPKGMDALGKALLYAQTNPEEHSAGDNFSIFTSWSVKESVAIKFARGPKGNLVGGVIMSKEFRRDELVYVFGAVPEEHEFLIIGIVDDARVRIDNKK